MSNASSVHRYFRERGSLIADEPTTSLDLTIQRNTQPVAELQREQTGWR